MGMRRVVTIGAAVAALAVLPACGKRFPFGERLLPESYGPPFGSALKDVIPDHPHNPAAEERHAASDAQENRRYASHAACNAAMRARLAAGAPHGPVPISSIESVGHSTAGDIVHEYRCTGSVLSYRAWHRQEAGHGNGHQSH